MGDSRYWSRCRLVSRFPLLSDLSLDEAPIVEEIIAPIDVIENDDLKLTKLINRVSNEELVPSNLFVRMVTATSAVWSFKKDRLRGPIGPPGYC